MSEDSTNKPRKRGGQPGNHNRLVHGRYVARQNLRVLPATGADQLTTLDHLIVAIKKSINHTYHVGLATTDLHMVNKTLRSLSFSAIGLCRLLHLRDRLTRLSDDLLDVDLEDFLRSFNEKEKSSIDGGCNN